VAKPFRTGQVSPKSAAVLRHSRNESAARRTHALAATAADVAATVRRRRFRRRYAKSLRCATRPAQPHQKPFRLRPTAKGVEHPLDSKD